MVVSRETTIAIDNKRIQFARRANGFKFTQSNATNHPRTERSSYVCQNNVLTESLHFLFFFFSFFLLFIEHDKLHSHCSQIMGRGAVCTLLLSRYAHNGLYDVRHSGLSKYLLRSREGPIYPSKTRYASDPFSNTSLLLE